MLYEYNDGMLPGGRRPRLYLARGAEVRKFEPSRADGWYAVVTTFGDKCGKWSNTTWTLELAPGVRPILMVSPMHGIWGERLSSWGEVVSELGLPVEVAREIVRNEYVGTYERLERIEAFAASVADTAETETVIVSFGAPTNRQIAAGYWTQPKSGKTSDGREVTVEPGPTGWDAPVAVAPEGARVVGSRHTPGMHGGYWAVEVAVAAQRPQQ